MMNEARRASIGSFGTRPPSTNTLFTCGSSRITRATSSLTFSVSESCEPGGSSSAITEREESCAGRKPFESRPIEAIEAAKVSRPTSTVRG